MGKEKVFFLFVNRRTRFNVFDDEVQQFLVQFVVVELQVQQDVVVVILEISFDHLQDVQNDILLFVQHPKSKLHYFQY